MSYMAIARKWRPNRFEEIVGQTHVTRTLTNAIALGRIHHALLFTGARGVGKTTAARAMARALNCTKGPTAEPCGECTSCIEILAGRSPDVIEIDGASNNSVDDIRDLRESVRYLPQYGKYKIYIIDEVHMLSKGAFNALLKTLEEPPDHVIFMFATTEAQKIPETILSRVQRFDFKRIPTSVVMERLKTICDAEGVSVSEGGIRLIARAGEGSMRDSQSLLDQVISFAGNEATTAQVAEILGMVDRRLLYQMLEGIVKGEADGCLAAVDEVHGYGYDLNEFTTELLELLRNATLVVLSPKSREYVDLPEEEVKTLEGIAQGVQPDVFVRAFQVLLDVHEQVTRSPRPRLVLEMAVARLVSIRPAVPIDQVLDKLHAIERRARHGGARARDSLDDSEGEPAPARQSAPPPREQAPRPEAEAPHNLSAPAPAARPEPPRSAPVSPAPSAPSSAGTASAAPRPERPWSLEHPRADDPPPPEPDGWLEVEEAPTHDPGPLAAEEALDPTPPGDVPEDEDAGFVGAAPPPLPGSASVPDREAALRRWWAAGGVRYDVLSEESVLLATSPPVLVLGLPSEFKSNLARQLADDARVKAGVRAYFPGCATIQASLRPVGSALLTPKEAREKAYQERVAALTAEFSADPIMARLSALFGATLKGVVPEDGEAHEQ